MDMSGQTMNIFYFYTPTKQLWFVSAYSSRSANKLFPTPIVSYGELCDGEPQHILALVTIGKNLPTRKESRMTNSNQPVNAVSVKQATGVPTRKVIAGGIAGALTTIGVFVLNTYVLPLDKPITAEISAAITTVLSFVIAYFVPPAASDQVTAS